MRSPFLAHTGWSSGDGAISAEAQAGNNQTKVSPILWYWFARRRRERRAGVTPDKSFGIDEYDNCMTTAAVERNG
jgi:hypothetical protein